MQLHFVGTGSILTTSLSAAAVIDNKILVDVPNGAMKGMRRQGLSPINLDACLITHFHGDHYFDVVFLLLELGLRQQWNQKFTLIGPPGLEDKVEALFSLAYPEAWDKVRKNSQVYFYELPEPGTAFSLTNYIVHAIPVQHGNNPAFGYIIDNSHSSIGFTGDTELCAGVETILHRVSTIIIDMAFVSCRPGHLSAPKVTELAQRFPHVKFIATHMSDEVRAHHWPGIILPNDGDKYQV